MRISDWSSDVCSSDLPQAGSVADWHTLLGNGAIRRLHLGVGDVNQAFERSGNAKAAGRLEKGEPDETFIDLYVALVSQPAIGRSLLGDVAFDRLAKRLGPDGSAILVMGEEIGRASCRESVGQYV